MKPHWTVAPKKTRQSSYRDTIGNPEQRAYRIHGLYGDLERAREKGQTAYAKYLEHELISLGEGDYTPADEGMAPKGFD